MTAIRHLSQLFVLITLVFGMQKATATAVTNQYKKAFLGGQVPISWSLYSSPNLGAPTGTTSDDVWDWNISYSIAQEVVRIGDTNWSQIDIYKMRGKDLDRVLAAFKKSQITYNPQGQWSRERIDGRQAQVFTFSLDEGREVSKGGTGGKMYFVKWKVRGYPGKGLSDYMKKKGIYDDELAIIINKQALINKEFEEGFHRFIRTINLDDINGIDTYF